MTYKGYTTHVEFDAEDRIYVGHVVGIPDIVVFHGATLEELEAAFREMVDEHLVACEQFGQEPDQSGSAFPV